MRVIVKKYIIHTVYLLHVSAVFRELHYEGKIHVT
jgi:hypothetical protein